MISSSLETSLLTSYPVAKGSVPTFTMDSASFETSGMNLNLYHMPVFNLKVHWLSSNKRIVIPSFYFYSL